jgi:hypothetical protein
MFSSRSFLFLTGVMFGLVACQGPSSPSDPSAGQVKGQPLSAEDSLYRQVMDIHDEVMPKMGKIRGAQQQAQQRLDSLATQAGSANKASRRQLEQLISDLNYADFAMDKWMIEFNIDSAKDNKALRMQYLQDELQKVQQVKAAILGSLASADSLIRR